MRNWFGAYTKPKQPSCQEPLGSSATHAESWAGRLGRREERAFHKVSSLPQSTEERCEFGKSRCARTTDFFVAQHVDANHLVKHIARWLFGAPFLFVFCLAFAFSLEALAESSKPNNSFSQSPDEIQHNVTRDTTTKKSLIPFAPLQPLQDGWNYVDDWIKAEIGLDLGVSVTTAFSQMTESLPGTDDHAFGYDVGLYGQWPLLAKGTEWEGFLSFLVQGRDSLFTDVAPGSLFVNAGSLAGPVDSFDDDQGFVLREYWWQQGSKDAGLMYRIGKIAPDTIVGTVSQFDSANLDFMALGQVVKLASRFPDAGFGGAVGFYPQGNSKHQPHLQLYISDQNGNRRNKGDLGEGEFFKGAEIGFRPFPQTDKAPHWRFSVWHADEQDKQGTSEGYGFLTKIEQELSPDGRFIGVLNYGHSWDAAFARNHLIGRLVIEDPFQFINPSVDLAGDRLGIGASWVDPAVSEGRDEYNLEVYYRFPLFPNLDVTFDAQYMIDPALIPIVEDVSPETKTFDDVFAFTVRFRTTF